MSAQTSEAGDVLYSSNTSIERSHIESLLEKEGAGYDFIQVLRLLQRLYPDREAVGEWSDPQREIARLHVVPTFAFPVSEVSGVDFGTESESEAQRRTPVRVGARFFGLTGPQGVLPFGYTEYALAREKVRDTAFRDFLDLFHHRLLSLFYRTWERYNTPAVRERGGEDRVRSHLLDLVGAGTRDAQRRSEVAPDTLAYYAGLLALRTRPALGLAQWVSDYFGVPATVDQFVGEWRHLTDGGQVCLGSDDSNSQLGQAVVGDAVYDAHSRVTLRLGPLSRTQFDEFLPNGCHHSSLKALAQWYTDLDIGVDAQLILRKDETPTATLGTDGSPKLGFGTWLRNKAPARDPDDVRIRLC